MHAYPVDNHQLIEMKKMEKMKKKMKKKCVVRDCANTSDLGTFVGDLCAPCHEFIAHGRERYSQAYRNSLRIVSAEFVQVLVDNLAQACDPTSRRRPGAR